ncbi:hypothetical protein SYJ56_08665 [Algoriphagus sp. D3-2-R+10]|uniref:hypothetical protein n=1 Tax=Algoriphagus aurantiacus TaxID=3103948 RepID=UPI002B39CE36|nr:hypothetical protein [Algoriphagus sp. D3-2-R+10]MEB2775377.1 hypothetical protein [Algoriphagus sp. D3-2-R+10]
MIYTLFMILAAVSIYQVSDDLSKVSLSLMNIMIMIVSLISAVFATTHFYNNLEFFEWSWQYRRRINLSKIMSFWRYYSHTYSTIANCLKV